MNGEEFYWDFPNEPIGNGNPYYRCSSCKISEPQINGSLEGHLDYCEFRKSKENERPVKQYPLKSDIMYKCFRARLKELHRDMMNATRDKLIIKELSDEVHEITQAMHNMSDDFEEFGG